MPKSEKLFALFASTIIFLLSSYKIAIINTSAYPFLAVFWTCLGAASAIYILALCYFSIQSGGKQRAETQGYYVGRTHRRFKKRRKAA